MNIPARRAWHERVHSSMLFLLVSVSAIVGGGVVAAAMAHAPSRKLLWMVAYLVLVVGVTQAALGVGQALLAVREAAVSVRAVECVLFNLGNAGVIGGTMLSLWPLVLVGTLLFAAALAVFLHATRHARGGWLIHAYRVLIVCIGGSAIVGLVLAALRATA
ncbi:MAG TPA: hypothetical protein VFE77_11305 [Rhodanobacter sp.]|nr:hypothetical protein [Rhodanobacter sp.]